MAKSNVTKEEARTLIDRVCGELGLIIGETGAFTKITSPTNKHRIYVQKTATLGRIDCTLDVLGQPGTLPLQNANGSVRCHIEPTLESLEKYMRMLGDSTVTTQVPNKPRPFAATKGPAKRTPTATAVPLPMDEPVLPVEYIAEGGTMDDRLKKIEGRVRDARVRLMMESLGISRQEAEERHDSPRRDEEMRRAREEARQQTDALAKETGLDFDRVD